MSHDRDGCNNPEHGAGCFCGDRERWRSVPDFDRYEVSDRGRVRSLAVPGRVRTNLNRPSRAILAPGPRLRKLVPDKDGYLIVTLRKDNKSFLKKVHALVLAAFVGPKPPGKEARHLNGVSIDNSLLNLKWGTPLENRQDKIAHGTYQFGQRNPASKLTDAQAAKIRSSREPLKILAARYGVRESTVSRIRNGVRRVH